MDASSIITQVSRDDEQLNSYPPEKGSLTRTENDVSEIKASQPGNKKVKRGFLRTLLCCLGRNRNKSQSPKQYVFGGGSPTSTTDSPRFLLPPIRHQDMHKMCMVIDLDETLVHSSFKPISNADFVVPVEIDGTVHQVGNYVKDLNKLGRELQQIVIVDNSPASYIFHPDNAVPVASWFDDMSDSELLDLIPFFEKLSKMDNVYTVLCNSNHPFNNGVPQLKNLSGHSSAAQTPRETPSS